jgi:hypothetical protein
MTAPKLTDLPLWDQFESRVLRVLRRALSLMPSAPPELGELMLNRLLFEKIAEANRLINAEDQSGFDYMPSYDGLPAPLDAAALPEESEGKRPDFTWSLYDHDAVSASEACREFVVECKRLGHAGVGHNINHLYVDLGVVRFVTTAHRYGAHGSSGTMVGYIQRSEHDSILGAVRDRCTHHNLADLTAEGDWGAALCELRQMLERSFGASPYKLVHLWVDLRPPE